MKNVTQVLCCLCFIAGLPGCVSFKVEPLPDPARILQEVTLCREIDESQVLLEPGEAVAEFRAGKDPVICFLYLKDVAQEVVLKWKWYSPDKILFKESDEVVINQEETYLEAVTAYDRIEPGALMEHQGQWSVSIFLNDVLLTRLSFKVIPDAWQNQRLHVGRDIP
ncbi:MAG: hypothetical protein WBB73_03985 [Candidatus Aminicenantaceae bacterium]